MQPLLTTWWSARFGSVKRGVYVAPALPPNLACRSQSVRQWGHYRAIDLCEANRYFCMLTPFPGTPMINDEPSSDNSFSIQKSNKIVDLPRIFGDAAEQCGLIGASGAFSYLASESQPLMHGSAGHCLHSPAMSPRHRFRISCLSKPLIAAVALESLIHNGIPLNEPIRVRFRELFDKCRFIDQSVSYLNLLSYSAGFDETKNWQYFHGIRTLSELPSALRAIKQLYPPGSHYMYSSLSIVILAYILERLHARPWDVILYKRMLEPASVPREAFNFGHQHANLAGSKQNIDFQSATTPPEYQLHIPLFQRIAAPLDLQVTPTELCHAGQDVLDIINRSQLQRIVSECTDHRSWTADHQYIDGASFGLFHYHNGCLGFWSNGNGQNSMLMIDPQGRTVLGVSTTSFPETMFFDELSRKIFKRSFIKEACLPRFELAACVGAYAAEGLQIVVKKVGADFCADLCYIGATGRATFLSGIIKYTGHGDYALIRPGARTSLERLSFLGDDPNSDVPQFARYAITICKRIR